MIRSLFFVARLVVAWGIALLALPSAFTSVFHEDMPDVLMVAVLFALVLVGVAGVSHVRRVRLIAGEVSSRTLSNRQRTKIEIPFEAGESFDLLAAAIRELPGVTDVKAARDSLQVRARINVDEHDIEASRFNPD